MQRVLVTGADGFIGSHLTEMLLEQGRITLPVLENRKLLKQVMKEAGFRPLHSEWWHFNLMSREEAKKNLKVSF